MYYFKKLLFAPFYLASFYVLLFLGKNIIENPNLLLSVNFDAYLTLIYFALCCLLTSFLFIVFVTLCQDWKFIGSTLLISNIFCFLLFKNPENLILATGFLCIGGLTYVLLDNKLKSYLTFQPTVILAPAIKNFAKLLVVLFSIAMFFTLTSLYQKSSFQLPDSLFDSVTKLIPSQSSATDNTESNPLSALSADQLGSLKSNPGLLKQFGIDEKSLSSFGTKSVASVTETSNNIIKEGIKSQVNKFIEPYAPFIPFIFSVLFLISLTSLISLVSILVSGIVWLLFYILEQIGFTRFVKEMREVKKLVV